MDTLAAKRYLQEHWVVPLASNGVGRAAATSTNQARSVSVLAQRLVRVTPPPVLARTCTAPLTRHLHLQKCHRRHRHRSQHPLLPGPPHLEDVSAAWPTKLLNQHTTTYLECFAWEASSIASATTSKDAAIASVAVDKGCMVMPQTHNTSCLLFALP